MTTGVPASTVWRTLPCMVRPAYGVLRLLLASLAGTTVHSAAGSKTTTLAGSPTSIGRPWRSPNPAIAAGFQLSAATTSATGMSSSLMARANAVSSPSMPGGAWSSGLSFASGGWGAWSVAMASIVPSASPALIAAMSAAVRNGGLTLYTASYPESSSSVSVKWCGVASAVTGRPSRLAARTSSTLPAVDRCNRWMRAPVSRANSMSRCTINSSAIAGQPGRPRWLQHEPSCITAPFVNEATSQCCASVMSRARAYSRAWRMSCGSWTPLPSSVNRCTPAAASSPNGASAFPCRFIVMHPAGCTSHRPARRAWARTNSTTASESCAGSVFGMATIAVNPPSAAARLPVSIVSASSRPGSRRCTCRSTKPGATMHPPASRFTSPSSDVATSTIRPSSMATSARRWPD